MPAISAIIGVVLALLLLFGVDLAIRPQMISLTTNRLQSEVTRIINQAVKQSLEQEQGAYDTLITMQSGPDGTLSALTANTTALNTLRTDVLEYLLEQIELLDTTELGIPLGNLTGWMIVSGRGPILPVRVLTAIVPKAEFRNVFTSAGINQTLHQVMLDVTVTVQLLFSGGTAECTVSAPVCVAETVLIGQVPETYLQISSNR